ncbi:hypothetical protein BDW68DRAFT_153333 [Aspergillus falconensis]
MAAVRRQIMYVAHGIGAGCSQSDRLPSACHDYKQVGFSGWELRANFHRSRRMGKCKGWTLDLGHYPDPTGVTPWTTTSRAGWVRIKDRRKNPKPTRRPVLVPETKGEKDSVMKCIHR